jgi:hypothetical protein
MILKKIDKKISFWDNIEEVVHKLIYPALLGSMLYGFIDGLINNNIDCLHLLFKSGIVIFYLLDYYHLYTFMEKSFPKRKKSCVCICIDFVVAVLLSVAFISECQILSYGCLCIIPFLFAIYAGILIDNGFKLKIPALHVFFGLIIIGISFWSQIKTETNEMLVIITMIFYYCILIAVERKYGTNNVDEYIELKSNKGNTYIINITEEIKSQDN